MRARWLAFAVLLIPTAQAAAQSIDIVIGSRPDGSMYMTPADVHVNIVDDVTMRVHNEDGTFHDLSIESFGGENVEFEVAPRATTTREFVANVEGTFRMICEVPGHVGLGMHGSFTVDSPNHQVSRHVTGPGAPSILGGALVCALLARRSKRSFEETRQQ